MLYRFVFVLAALDILIAIQGAKRPFNLEIHSFTCHNQSARVKEFDCDFKKLSTNRYILHFAFALDGDLNQKAEMHALTRFKFPQGTKLITFLNLKLNICDNLSRANGVPLLKDLIVEMRRDTNLPYSCPIKGNVLYNIGNLSVTEANLPTYTPNINFNFTLDFYENQKLLGGLRTQGATVPRS